MTRATWEISALDVSEVDAKVVVHYRHGLGKQVELHGFLRGPYCESARTLPAEYPFRDVGKSEAIAVVNITDPCLWSEELPHLYRAEVTAHCGDVVVAEYHGEIGLRRTSPAKNFDGIQ